MNEYVNAGIEAVKIPDESVLQSHHVASMVSTPLKGEFPTPNSSYIASMNSDSFGNNSYNRDSIVTNTNEMSLEEKPIVDHSADDVKSSNVSNGTTSMVEQLLSSERIESTSELPSYEESGNIQDSLRNLPESVSSIQEDDESNDSSSDSDDSESLTSDEKTTDPELDGKTIDTVAESGDIRTELSSVVPPTSMSLEVTASRETDTALPDVIADKILANESINHVENEPATNIKGHQDDEYVTNDKVHLNDQPIEENNGFDTSNTNDRLIKPITFETAATMDDVSDTELESYLQELEDLEENPMKMSSECVKSAVESIKSEDIEPYANENAYNVDGTIENIDEINQIGSRDDRNADSFSQASTVEFGEVIANSSNEQPENVNSDQNIESSADDLEQNIEATQSMNLVVATESTVEMTENQHEHQQCENQQEQQAQSTSEAKVLEREREISSDLESQTGCELDEQIGNVAKRPNSLNLQNCITTSVDQTEQDPSNSDINFGSSENAGNTPAADGQFLSSSISSDDSNITTDNNHMIVSIV